jgi:hypothetical protein
MRDVRIRKAFLGLILAFPFLIVLVSGPSSGRPVRLWGSDGGPLLAVEVLLIGGLVYASRERARLLSRIGVATVPTPRIAAGSQASRAVATKTV